jgi:hypothetical protein
VLRESWVDVQAYVSLAFPGLPIDTTTIQQLANSMKSDFRREDTSKKVSSVTAIGTFLDKVQKAVPEERYSCVSFPNTTEYKAPNRKHALINADGFTDDKLIRLVHSLFRGRLPDPMEILFVPVSSVFPALFFGLFCLSCCVCA